MNRNKFVGFEKIVELLLSKGADINHKNNEGQKARDIASQRGKVFIWNEKGWCI